MYYFIEHAEAKFKLGIAQQFSRFLVLVIYDCIVYFYNATLCNKTFIGLRTLCQHTTIQITKKIYGFCHARWEADMHENLIVQMIIWLININNC